jgi:uncharacterized membrane protein
MRLGAATRRTPAIPLCTCHLRGLASGVKATRLEAFSDGVIAIIITIMVLELKAPHDAAPVALKQVLPVFLSYVLSFVIVAIYWVNHHHLIHLAQKVDGKILWANINLLFWMSLIPWVTAYLGHNFANSLAVGLYALVATVCGASFYLLRASISCHHRGDERLHALHCRMGRKNLLALAIYSSAIPLAWVSIPLSLLLVALPAIMYFMPDRQLEALQDLDTHHH